MAKSTSIKQSTLKDRIAEIRRSRTPEQPAAPAQTSPLVVNLRQDTGELIYHGAEIRDVDALLDHVKIDRDVWEVAEASVNHWEIAGKKHSGADDRGKRKPDSLWKTGLLQIRVKLRRKAPKYIQDGILGLVERLPKAPAIKPKSARKGQPQPFLAEFSLYDTHFGKVAHRDLAGVDYNLEVAVSDYRGAVEDLIQRTAPYQIREVIIPVGNDCFHYDSARKQTTSGTQMDATGDALQHVFRAGFTVLDEAVQRIADEVAPVRLLWVGGNHDRHTSWYLTECLRHRYSGSKYVTVQNERSRYYHLHGVNLLGWHHGDGMPLDRLASLMPVEAPPEYWAKSRYRFIRTGHLHSRKKIKYLGSLETAGVQVDVIPSLSATDEWHYLNGYVGALRAAEVALWHAEAGPAGQFPVEARSAVRAG